MKDVWRLDEAPTDHKLVCEKCLPDLKRKLKRMFDDKARSAAQAETV